MDIESMPIKLTKNEYKTLYQTWADMKKRCLNKKNKSYKNYGGRGIKVCDRWLSLNNFIEDMGKKPKNKSINRIDNDKDYEPSNCEWASGREQNFNKSKLNNCSSKYIGVYYNKKIDKYRVQIRDRKKIIYLGTYEDEDIAGECYDMALCLYYNIWNCPNRKIKEKNETNKTRHK